LHEYIKTLGMTDGGKGGFQNVLNCILKPDRGILGDGRPGILGVGMPKGTKMHFTPSKISGIVLLFGKRLENDLAGHRTRMEDLGRVEICESTAGSSVSQVSPARTLGNRRGPR
jgi:hypothetical protein